MGKHRIGCIIEGCNNKHFGKGYCKKHHEKWRKYGDPLFRIKERHGMHGTKEYRAWFHIKNRCLDPKTKHFNRYGGRGITICDRWKNSFTAFFEDMGKAPFVKYEIDRIDNEGNYEPGNCRWISKLENMRNASHVKLNMRKAREIRTLYKTGNYTETNIADIFNVSRGAVASILHNRTWREPCKNSGI